MTAETDTPFLADRVYIGDTAQPAAVGRPTCQCRIGASRCLASIDQEDLLCDTCRRGCDAQAANGHWQLLGTFQPVRVSQDKAQQ
jgi:hypothetical protein